MSWTYHKNKGVIVPRVKISGLRSERERVPEIREAPISVLHLRVKSRLGGLGPYMNVMGVGVNIWGKRKERVVSTK